MKLKLSIIATVCAAAAIGAAQTANSQQPATAPATAIQAPRPGTPQHQVDPAIAAFVKPIEATTNESALRQKLTERHNTAVRLLQLRIDEYRNGMADTSGVFEAAREVADAKLALAQDAREREAVLQQVVDVNKAVEARLERQWKAGLGAEAGYLRARLAREAAEAELLKTKQATTAPTTRP